MLVLVVVAAGFILTQALGSAATYYYNADQAVAKRSSLGDKDFRIQGTVTKATVQKDDGTTVTIAQRDDGDVQMGDRVVIVYSNNGMARAVRDTGYRRD